MVAIQCVFSVDFLSLLAEPLFECLGSHHCDTLVPVATRDIRREWYDTSVRLGTIIDLVN